MLLNQKPLLLQALNLRVSKFSWLLPTGHLWASRPPSQPPNVFKAQKKGCLLVPIPQLPTVILASAGQQFARPSLALPASALANRAQYFGSTAVQKGTMWDGKGTQEELMIKDQCITVDEADNLTGSASKYDVHRFNACQPRGVLHRAFSVFLFNNDNKLLLQQRASGKITFPNAWTNTCCSHPLHGQDPPELDAPEAITTGTALGAKMAAVRKLQHELGISPRQLPASRFKYLTRLHYCAADSTTYGQNAGWGEHEMDYILFAKADVVLQPNLEEVRDTKYVTADELRAMMAPDRGLLWSPWFRIICERFLDGWWKDLDRTVHTNDLQDLSTIHSILK